MDTRIVIVGGGLAAARTAEQLTRAQFDGQLTIVSDEVHLPYDRPPLSKQVLRNEVDDVSLKPREYYEDNGITLKLGSAARSLDPVARILTLADGTSAEYDELIIATGLEPKRIPSFPELAGIHVLRSIDECVALRVDAASADRAVVVGAGFIGCEVAASLRSLDVDVSMIEPQSQPLASVLGEQIGALIARLHHSEGVDLRTKTGVNRIAGVDHVSEVELTDGSLLKADLVVVGIGSRPAIDWLDGSGVSVDNGIVCDDVGRTTVAHVWSLGDVAKWRDDAGRQARVEHWSNVAEQARLLVPALIGSVAPPKAAAVPYFWSDQYDVKIQCLGEPHQSDTIHLACDDGRKFLAYYEREGRVASVVGAGRPAEVMKTRAKIAANTPIGDVLS